MSVGNSERPNANLGKKTATSDVFQEFADLDAGGGGGDDGWRTRPFRDYGKTIIDVGFQHENRGCEDGMIPYGVCENENDQQQKGVRLVGTLPACTFPVNVEDVVFGIWHSLNTEESLIPQLQTWAKHQVQVVFLASKIGVKKTKLFKNNIAKGSNPLLLNTGIKEDDYFSTLGKALIGQKMITELYPKAKWYAIIGDDNYIYMSRYLRLISAFDPEEPIVLTRLVYRKGECAIPGGASILTSRRLALDLAPHLEPYFSHIYKRVKGKMWKAPKQEKYHDLAYQALVERNNGVIYHLDALLQKEPGFYYSNQGKPRGPAKEPLQVVTPSGNYSNPKLPAVFHYVRGPYLLHVHSLSNVYTCNSVSTPSSFSISTLAVGVYHNNRSISTVADEARIRNTWEKSWDGPGHPGLVCWMEGNETLTHTQRIQKLLNTFPLAQWFLLVSADNYVVLPNVVLRINAFEHHQGSNYSTTEGKSTIGKKMVVPTETYYSNEGPILISRELAEAIVVHILTDHLNEETVERIAEDIAPGSVVFDPEMTLSSKTKAMGATTLSAAAVIDIASVYSELTPRDKRNFYTYEIAHFIIKNGERGACHASLHNVGGPE